MDYKQQELVKEIKSFLESFVTKNDLQHLKKNALEADIKWNASNFFAHLLYESEQIISEKSINEFNEFVDSFNTQNGILINVDSIFEKYWLRNVLGKIKIPSTIISICNVFIRIKGLKNELKFLSSFYTKEPEENRKKIDKKYFEKKLKEYEIDNSLKLNLEQIYKQQWLSLKDGVVKLSAIDIHFEPFIKFWNEFLFISKLKDTYYDVNKKKNRITKAKFHIVYDKFSALYPEIPTIGTLIDQQVLREEGVCYIINLLHTKEDYWSALNDKICGCYWQLLNRSSRTDSGTEKLKRFLDTVFYFHNISSNFLKHSSQNAKENFLNTAYNLLIDEPDILGAENEFEKVRIDSEGARGINFLLYYERIKDDYSLDTSDYFELYKSFELWEKRALTTYLYDQSSREEFSFLVSVIVHNDFEFEYVVRNNENEPSVLNFKRVFGLLKESKIKPALLWEISCYIKSHRPEILGYMLIDSDFLSLAFTIIDSLKFPEKLEYELKLELWKKSLSLCLIAIRNDYKKNNELNAKIIFQIFRQLNGKKYDIPYRRQDSHIENQISYKRKNREEVILSLIEDSPINNSNVQKSNYLLPSLFNDLINHFLNFKIKPIYNIGTVQFPLLQWDGFIWLMRCSTYWKYKPQFTELKPETVLLTNSYFTQYLSLIELEEIESYDIIKQETSIKLPTWSEKIENLEFLDWLYPIYFFYHQQKLNSFLEPRLFIEKKDDQYNGKNQLIISKLRTHVGVLLQVFSKLINTNAPYGFNKEDLLEIKRRIEQQIIDYLKKHIENNLPEGRVDLFNYHSEGSFNSSAKERLLPQLTRVINWFEKKDEIVDSFSKIKDIGKILTLAESITAEGIRKKLIHKIKQSELKDYLEKSHWIPEIQNTLSKIMQYPELINMAEEVIKYWEKNALSERSPDNKDYLYKTKLIIAYLKKDEEELNSIILPEVRSAISNNKPNHQDYKNFYKALLNIQSASEVSYHIFNDLVKRYSKYTVFALNRMAAKMNLAQNSNNLDLYRETIEEWSVYVKENCHVEEINLDITFYSNLMECYYQLTDFESLSSIYAKLDLPDRMNIKPLEIKINSLIEQNKIEDALIIIEDASNYHKYSKEEELEFIEVLKSKVSGIDNIEELKIYYDRIINCKPEKLIKILPEKLNGRIDLNEFIAKEIAIAANKMLDKINSVSKIQNEDKYNDIVQLALEARLSTWGWTVKDQTRKAFSPSKDAKEENLGEIDLDIQDYNKNSFITCEAFILRDITRVQSHIEKVIAHYTSKKDAFIILVYFKGQQRNFLKKWNEYSLSIVPNLSFPKGFNMIGNSINDLSINYGFKKSAIKIGCSEHEDETILYHVFVNLDYQIK